MISQPLLYPSSTHRPNVYIMPVYNRVYAHESRPTGIGRVEMCQVFAVWICATCTNENGLHRGCVVQVICKGILHRWLCIFEELQRVCLHADLDKVLNLLEGMRGLDVHAFDGGFGVGVWIARGETLFVKRTEVQDQENEAVFPAVVGNGELWESGCAVSATPVACGTRRSTRTCTCPGRRR